MLDRTKAPTYFPIQGFQSIHPEHLTFSNGMNVFVFDSGEQDLVRMEWIFKNSYTGEVENALLNSCLSALILEGTEQMSNAEIAETVDYYGAYLVPEFSVDHSSLTLFTLNKHLHHLLSLIYTLFNEATFPEKEVNTYLRNSKQRLEIALKKNDFTARRLFNNTLFGHSRYGNVVTAADYDKITISDLKELYSSQFTPENCVVIIAGKVEYQTLEMLRNIFDQTWNGKKPAHLQDPPSFPSLSGQTLIEERPDALQSALRLGYRSIPRSHPDFPGLQLVNTILGGYFGSRLMVNIREDKGYTYGIGSGIVSLMNGAYHTISTEVGVDVTRNTLQEIEHEIHVLRTERVSDAELHLVKNYMMGSLLGSLENIFSHADKFKQVYFSGLDLSYFDYYQQVIQEITADNILQLAQTYLDYDRMEKVIVGKYQQK